MAKRRYLVGYEIVGHIDVVVDNPQAASAEAIGRARAAARSLLDAGDNEYRVPFGRVIEVGGKASGRTKQGVDHGANVRRRA